MYTECPHCQTCFRISEDHLRVAGGKVRCGSCQEIFDATQHLFKNLTDREPITDFQIASPPTPPPKPPPAPAPAPAASAGTNSATPPSPTKTLDEIRRERANIPNQQQFMESVIGNNRYNNLDQMGPIKIPGEMVFGDSFIREPEKPTAKAKDKPVTGKDVSPPRTAYEDIESKESEATEADHASIKDFYAQVDAQLHEGSAADSQDDRSQLDKDIDELLAFAKGLDAGNTNPLLSVPEQAETEDLNLADDALSSELEDEFDLQAIADFEIEHATTSEEAADNESPAEQPLSTDSDVVTAEASVESLHAEGKHDEMVMAREQQTDHVAHEDTKPAEEDIPLALRRSLDMLNQRPRRSLGTSLLLVLLILVLFGGLGFQIVLFRNVELAQAFPSMIPMLNQVCDRIPCRYGGKVDVSQIKLQNRDVRSDPKQANALLISATFVDEAPFDQPYPNILITLYDLGGNVVASRRFTPQEYLESMYNRFLLMEAGTPVHVTLAVLDPGKDAINFEFKFQ